MSLPDFSTQSSLFSTAALSGSLFPADDRYRLFATMVFPRLVAARPELATCYCADNGRVAIEPVLLLGISLLQFLDGLPDRAAVEMLRYHAGWNFALNRQLGDELFHPTTLVNFRQRLIEKDLSAVGFRSILDGLVESGLVPRRGRQRLDSTQIFGKVSRMSRLECVRETVRLALLELESVCAKQKPEFWPLLWERYVQSKLDYRVEVSVLEQKMKQAGSDAWLLLQWLESQAATVGKGEQVQLLGQVWEENFQVDDAGQAQQQPSPPAGAVQNPHDPEAQWACKGVGKNRKEHVGYKVQVAESVAAENVAKGEPTSSFITAIVTQPAIGSDDAGLPLVEREQQSMGLDKPSELYVDGAYISAERLVQAQQQGRELIGPAQPAPRKEGRFSVEDFAIDVEARKAICPGARESTQCSRLEEESTGKVTFRLEWSYHCHDCPLRDRCLGENQRHRTVVVGQHHTVLQARRREQQTDAFKTRAQRRNAIEGTQSELVRAHGLRRARYRGLFKVRLQNYFIGAACNIKRWLRRKQWLLRQVERAVENNSATTVA